jgi:uncharacterized protein YuzE
VSRRSAARCRGFRVRGRGAGADEARPGIILDFDAAGDLVAIEILDASRRVTQADRMEFETV